MPYCPIDTTPLTSNAVSGVTPANLTVEYSILCGIANAGVVPTWVEFVRSDTKAALTQPALSAVSASGWATFSVDWATVPPGVVSIRYTVTVNGAELGAVIYPSGA